MNINKRSLPIMALAIGALALSGCSHELTASAAKSLFDSYDGAENFATIMKVNGNVLHEIKINDEYSAWSNRSYQIDRTENNYYAYIKEEVYIPSTSSTVARFNITEMLITSSNGDYYQYEGENSSYTMSRITSETAKETLSGLFSTFQSDLVANANSKIVSCFTGEEVEGASFIQSGQALNYNYTYNTPDGISGSTSSTEQKVFINNLGLLVTYESTITQSATGSSNESSDLNQITTIIHENETYYYDSSFTKLASLGGINPPAGDSTTTEDSTVDDSATSDSAGDNTDISLPFGNL